MELGVDSFGDTRPHTLGILGAGRAGTAVARQALRAGLDVQIAASGDPADISLIVEVMAPGAVAVTRDDAAARAVVMAMVDRLGYDAVDAGVLAAGVVFEPGRQIFTGRHDREGLEALLTTYPQLTEASA